MLLGQPRKELVRFGTEESGSVYGKVDGSPHVFVAGNALVGLARAIYVSRASMRVDPSRIESVRVAASKPASKSAAILRDAVSGFIADRVESLGEPDVGTVDMTIDVTTTEGGATKRIVCGAPDKQERRKCASPDVRAVFSVLRGTWTRFFEGGNLARDAGSR